MMRDLGDGYELDDDVRRIDIDAVHSYIGGESYWAKGRSRETMERLVKEAGRTVGLYHDGTQVGFCRALTDGATLAYLADVYVLEHHRGRGLGMELVREMIDRGPYARLRWLLYTKNAHGLYERFGFRAPGDRLLERGGQHEVVDEQLGSSSTT